MCQSTLDELLEVLQRTKYDRHAPLATRMDFWTLVSERAQRWELDAASEQAGAGACRDKKGRQVSGLGTGLQRRCLISSDADLLVLSPWNGIPITTPAAFLRANNKH
ncbi:MAG: putative toxin-antitoxin system toxin component, PIN family [Burkholderiales bacterium]|nr:putative toxin-antitoxin system toxin component, PIN family [Burkholderiales bacterium]